MNRLLNVFIIFSFSFCLAQNEKSYFVSFTDKGNINYTIEECLSERAIRRYELNNVDFTYQDYKVYPFYIDSLSHYGDVLYSLKWLNGVVISSSNEGFLQLDTLGFIDSIAFVGQENLRSRRSQKLNDETSSEEVYFEEIHNRKELLGLQTLEKSTDNGQDVWVAVIDAGFLSVNTSKYFEHLFTDDKILDTYDFVDVKNDVYTKHGHGTNCLSAIVGKSDTISFGVSPFVSVGMYITENVFLEQPLEMYLWLAAIERIDSIGYDIVSSSLGYHDFDSPFQTADYSSYDGVSLPISKGASIAAKKGLIVVTGAGNSGTTDRSHIGAPADAKGILTVGAVSINGNPASFSSIGPTSDGRVKPEVSAVGINTTIVSSSGNLSFGSGTSFAAPQIASVLAALKSKYPTYTKSELIDLLIQSSSLFENPDNKIGYGVPDFNNEILGDFDEENQLLDFLDRNYRLYDLQGRPVKRKKICNQPTIYIVKYIKDGKFNVRKVLK